MNRLVSILTLLLLTYGLDAAPLIGRRVTTPVVSVGGDPYFSSVTLLTHMNGSDGSTTFTDSSSYAHTLTAFSDAQIDTAQYKFGGASGLFDGTGDYCSIPANTASLYLTNKDFTVEAWVRFASVAATRPIISQLSFLTGNGNWSLYWRQSPARLEFFATTNGLGSGAITVAGGSWTPTLNTWYHVAATRNGSDFKLWIDGTQTGSTVTNANTIYSDVGYDTRIGGEQNATLFMNGHIDDLRLTVGVSRYNSNFTPPTQQFPDN